MGRVEVMMGYPVVVLRNGRREYLDSDGIATTLSKSQTSVRNINNVGIHNTSVGTTGRRVAVRL